MTHPTIEAGHGAYGTARAEPARQAAEPNNRAARLVQARS